MLVLVKPLKRKWDRMEEGLKRGGDVYLVSHIRTGGSCGGMI